MRRKNSDSCLVYIISVFVKRNFSDIFDFENVKILFKTEKGGLQGKLLKTRMS